MSAPRLLAGIRVVDGSANARPASACVQILAQLGADITPWDDHANSAEADIWVRGDNELDLRSEKGLSSGSADVSVVGTACDHPALVLLAGAHAAVAALGALRWARRERRVAPVTVKSTEVLATCLGETLHRVLCPRHDRRSGTPRPSVEVLPCADGWVGVAAPTPLHRELLARLTGVPAVVNPDADLGAMLGSWLADRTREEVFHEAQLWQLPVVPALRPDELLTDTQCVDRGVWAASGEDEAADLPARSLAGVHRAQSPFRVTHGAPSSRLDRTPLDPLPPPSSCNDGHSINPLPRPSPPCASTAPLGDVQVLDLGMVWAGPYCGRLLASLGAHVVKIEGPRHVDGTRATGTGGCRGVYADLNQGKASLVLDLTAPEGRTAFMKLVADSDVVVENFSPRVMPNFGLDAHSLGRANPSLISLALPAFGSTGPWANYVAYGSALELATGLAGLDASGRPEPAPVPYLDYMAGTYGAAAILAALLARDATDTGCHIEVAQREVACQLVAFPSPRGREGHAEYPYEAPRYGSLDGEILVADPALGATGLFAAPSRESEMCVHFARPPWLARELPNLGGRPAPALGANSRAVLRGAGLSDAEIDRLVATGVVLEAAPEERGRR